MLAKANSHQRDDFMKEYTLNDLKTGAFGTVIRMECSGAMKRRLIDMGITPGVKIKLVKVAPLGDPLQIKLRGYELSIRRSQASEIFIEKENS